MNHFYQNVNIKNILVKEIELIKLRIKEIDKQLTQLKEPDNSLPLNQVLLGDCLDVIKTLPDNSVDCVVTDPPYSLGKVKSVSKLVQSWLNGEDGRGHHTKGFCGKDWDIMPSPTVWREVFRVLKPGGYLLAFAGTRTYDLMGLSIRLAGFELQDSIEWFYSRLIWTYAQGFPKGKTQLKPANEPILIFYKPGNRQLNIDDCRLNLSKRYPSNVILSHTPKCVACGTKRVKGSHDTTGVWGEKNSATGFLKGLKETRGKEKPDLGYTATDGTEEIAAYQCHESCPIALLDVQTAQSYAGVKRNNRYPNGYKYNSDSNGNCYNKGAGHQIGSNLTFYQDNNSTANASRFFLNLPPEAPFIYQPKASKNDRTVNGKVENTHVTVKPTNLMAYLVRLVCPPDGVVLDPFIGSGTTALACIKENRNYIGIEREQEYYDLACERIKAYQAESEKTQ